MSSLLAGRLAMPDIPGLSPEQIVAKLNAPDSSLPTITVLKPTRIGPGTVMDALGPAQGAAFLDTLTALSASNPTIKWALKIIDRGEFDISVLSARNQIDGLVAVNILTSTQASALKSLAEVTRHKSWAEHTGVAVDVDSVISTISGTASKIWLSAGTKVPNTQYVVTEGGVFSPQDLVGCAAVAGEPPVVSFTAAHIIS